MRKEKGITLIVLVVTIVIMLILAGVVITIMVNAGLFGQANKAKKDTEIANIKEKIGKDISNKYLDQDGEISDDDIRKILDDYGDVISDESEKPIGVNPDEYPDDEILLSDIWDGNTSDGIIGDLDPGNGENDEKEVLLDASTDDGNNSLPVKETYEIETLSSGYTSTVYNNAYAELANDAYEQNGFLYLRGWRQVPKISPGTKGYAFSTSLNFSFSSDMTDARLIDTTFYRIKSWEKRFVYYDTCKLKAVSEIKTAEVNLKGNSKINIDVDATGTDYIFSISHDNTNWTIIELSKLNGTEEITLTQNDKLYIKINCGTSTINSIKVTVAE
jgi:type II secretory pathway pseudopilin PulG